MTADSSPPQSSPCCLAHPHAPTPSGRESAPSARRSPLWLGVSLKTYFSHAHTLAWARSVAEIARTHPALHGDRPTARLFVIPTFPALVPVIEAFADTPVLVGAQDVSAFEPGAHTGDVSAAELAEIGCAIAEIGHAERRRDHHENELTVAAKVAVSRDAGLIPLLCVGERTRTTPQDAARVCLSQAQSLMPAGGLPVGVRRAQPFSRPESALLAYEPHWAIGASEPAPADYVQQVCALLRGELCRSEPAPSEAAVLYGGSARPGLLSRLGAAVDGLFLGRFAHDPASVRMILDECLRR